jgi:hypothetical protein
MSVQNQDPPGTDAPLPGSYTLVQGTSDTQIDANFQSSGAVTATDTSGVSYSGAWAQMNYRPDREELAWILAFSLTPQGQSTTTVYLGTTEGGSVEGNFADSAGNSGDWDAYAPS